MNRSKPLSGQAEPPAPQSSRAAAEPVERAVVRATPAVLPAGPPALQVWRPAPRALSWGIPVLALALALGARAEQPLPPQLAGVEVVEQLGRKVDLGLTFVNENGHVVKLGDFFHPGRPVILNLVYYSCPMLCTLVLNGQTSAMSKIPWTPGEEYEVVTISIDPTETSELARGKKAGYVEQLGRGGAGWHFLTDVDGHVKTLADQVGFHYKYDEKIQQYAHQAAIMMLTPGGAVSRYLYGVDFRPRDVRLALTEASEGKFGLSVDRLLLFCYHYDPSSRSYVPFAANVMKAGGAVAVLMLAGFIGVLWRQERRNPRREAALRIP